ncbi:C6 finger domain protein [Cordyceps militaris CM01]|uniref:C6 finger domain protein n=1 Tax=Cordyceps militaris (strain CM01) TaxID=983644 RepID=G3J2L2_CORMM|nr:C6 finger domain protein [Cordyceps militaris CM01]EGX95548.1 C6 finger domain protein [Cordyceps militaris CM01]
MPHQSSGAAADEHPAAVVDPTTSSAPAPPPFDAAAAAAAAAANKTRRSHRKSRNGCTECKRRHIRCDEHRPVCSNCVSADRRACVFPRGPSSSSKPPDPTNSGAGTSSPSTSPANNNNNITPPSPRRDFPFDQVCGPLPHPGGGGGTFRRSNYTYYPKNGNATAAVPPPTPPGHHTAGLDADASVFSPFHLQIMHHLQTVMMPDPTINTSNHFQQFVDIAMRHALDAPYLINELLALGAVHMATQKENQLLQQQQQQQQQNQQTLDSNGSSASHAPAVLPPLLPPHGSPASTSSPSSASSSASSSTLLPSLSTATAAAAHPVVANLRHQATELQTRAVANFTRLTAHLPPDDTASCIPRFLFSSTLSMHALADSLAELRAANADFDGFIDRFVDCFNLYRGIRAVIYPTWRFLSDSELRPLLQVTREANLGIVARGRECEPLRALLDRSDDLAPASVDACREAVEKLQWAFDLHNNLPRDSGQHAVSAFSVILGADYVDVLRKHRPEALIILSYFAVLLHRCRHFWIFQNSGACMIKAIANHIGSYWRDAMVWPLQVIETEDC